MSGLILPSRFSSQPQQLVSIDSPWAGAVAVLPFVGYATNGTARATTGTITNGVGAAGKSRIISSESNIFDSYPGTWSQLATPYSILSLYRLTATPSATVRVSGNFTVNGSGYGVAPNGTNFRFIVARSGVNTTLIGGAVSTLFKCDVGVVNGTTATFYENGKQTATASHGGVAVATGTFRIGSDNSAASSAKHEHYLSVIFPWALTPSQVARLSENPLISPWQVFKVPQRKIWVSGSSSGAFQPAWAANSTVLIHGARMKKNVASQVIGAQLISKTDGSDVTTGTTTIKITGDGGTQATGTVGSGACTHEGSGFWTYAPSQAETNYDHIAFTFTNTAACTSTVQAFPSFPQTGDNFTLIGATGSGLTSLATQASVNIVDDFLDTEIAAIKSKTDSLPSDPADASDIAASFSTVNSTLATIAAYIDTEVGAIYSRIGAPAGASIAADIAGISAGDPWTTALPGAYGAGTAGKLIGDNLDAAISSRASQTTANTIAGYIDAEITDIQSRLPAALVDGRIDASVGAMAANVMTAAAAAADLTTELQSGLATAASLAIVNTATAAIQVKTDSLPSDPADQSLIIDATTAIMSRLGTPAGASVAADIVAVKAETASIQADTNDIQTRLPAALVGGRIDANSGAISGSATAADNLEAGALALVPGTCAAGSTTTAIITNLTEVTNDHYNGRVITFTGGALVGQGTSISGYNGTTKTLTVVALTEAPVITDSFVIS